MYPLILFISTFISLENIFDFIICMLGEYSRLKRGTKTVEYFVKSVNYEDKYNQWIAEEDIELRRTLWLGPILCIS